MTFLFCMFEKNTLFLEKRVAYIDPFIKSSPITFQEILQYCFTALMRTNSVRGNIPKKFLK